MSERWGFDLSMEAVRLVRRDAGHWQEVARQKIEGADIEDRLQRLAERVDPPAPVYIFLPHDQILYTDVKISAPEDAAAEIDAAMVGRTPYALSELEIDWEQGEPGEVRVAAIARETLDEAEAFATARGLTVAGFSALADPSDFPRLPDFGGVAVDLLSEGDDPGDENAAMFTSGRTSDPMPTTDGPVAVLAEDVDQGPVVRVDDPNPVLQLPKSDLPPLDPGVPLPRLQSEPRVFTNVGAASASMRAASLTAEPPVKVRPRDRALPTPALAAVAALLSVGIAIIIWAIVPTTPVTSDLAAPTPLPEITGQPEDAAAVELSGVAPDAPVLEIALAEAPVILPAPKRPSDIAQAPAQTTLARLPDDILTIEHGAVPNLAVKLDKRPQNLVGLEYTAPGALAPNGIPLTETSRGIIIAALDGIVPKTDAFALPTLNFDPDAFVDTGPPALPSDEEEIAALPDAGVAPTQDEVGDGTETDTSGLVPETVPESGEASPEDGPRGLIPTELARALTDRAPRARPQNFTTRIERQNYGGRTLVELNTIRPGPRPASAQVEALLARASNAPSELAVEASFAPRLKPRDFDAIVAATQVQREARRQAAILAARTPDTTAALEAALAEDTAAEEAAQPQVSPGLVIPTSVSVARQATLENAIRLNRVNLVGVYGLASDRRALVRLPSGRYVKVKVGDKVDGGTVASISESELRYTRRGKTIALLMPKG